MLALAFLVSPPPAMAGAHGACEEADPVEARRTQMLSAVERTRHELVKSGPCEEFETPPSVSRE